MILVRLRCGEIVRPLIPVRSVLFDLVGGVLIEIAQIAFGMVDRGARDLVRRFALDLVGAHIGIGVGVAQQRRAAAEILRVEAQRREVRRSPPHIGET